MRSRRCPVRGLPVWQRRCLPRQIRVAQRLRRSPPVALHLPFRARPTTCVVIPGSARPMALTEFTTGWYLVSEDSLAGLRSRHGFLYNCGGTRVACGSLGSPGYQDGDTGPWLQRQDLRVGSESVPSRAIITEERLASQYVICELVQRVEQGRFVS